MKWGSNFIILHLDIQQSQHYLLKSYFFPIEWSQHPCQKSGEHKHMGLFLDSQVYSCHHHVYCVPVPRCVVYCCFAVSFEMSKYESSQFALLFSRLFWLFWVPCKFHMNFKMSFSMSMKNLTGTEPYFCSCKFVKRISILGEQLYSSRKKSRCVG